MDKWDKRFLDLAKMVAGWSKDPSTKVGAVIADGKQIVSIGFNGFPPDIEDKPESLADRKIKLSLIVHAEENAIRNAARSVAGCTMYVWPIPPCDLCAYLIVESAICRIVAPTPSAAHSQRWGTSFAEAKSVFRDFGVNFETAQTIIEPK